MPDVNPNLSSQVIEMMAASVTRGGEVPLSEWEAERLLNVITRANPGTPTGSQKIL